MNKFIRYNICFLALFLLSIASAVAGQDTIEMADQLREDGKIYVVVAVLLIIFAGLIFYLFSIDLKLKKLEDRFKIR